MPNDVCLILFMNVVVYLTYALTLGVHVNTLRSEKKDATPVEFVRVSCWFMWFGNIAELICLVSLRNR